MSIVKIGNVGDGQGAFSVEHGSSVPTYGDKIETERGLYEVTEVRRFTTNRRQDAVRVDVTPLEDGQKVIV